MFIEPLLRWLKVGDRGYRCGCMPADEQLCINALGYADDLVITAGDTVQMKQQIAKLEAFCTWSGMALAPSKCDASGILYDTGPQPTEWDRLQPLLQSIQVNLKPVGVIKPHEPFSIWGWTLL